MCFFHNQQARQYHIEKHEVEQKRKLMVEAVKSQKQEQVRRCAWVWAWAWTWACACAG